MDWRDRIVVGAGDAVPVVRGTALAVELLAELLDTGWRAEQVLASFPELSLDDLRACLAFDREFGGREVESGGWRPAVAHARWPANHAIQLALAVA